MIRRNNYSIFGGVTVASSEYLDKVDPDKLIKFFGAVFSTVIISGINVVVSGHLLGYILNLEEKDGDKNYFGVSIPPFIKARAKGTRAIAGLAAFGVSIVIVGLFLSNQARDIFIVNMAATKSQWTACQALATSISLTFCILLAFIKVTWLKVWLVVNARDEKRPDPPRKRAENLTAGS